MIIVTKLLQLFSVLKTLFASKSVENTTEIVKEVVETVQQAIQAPEPKVVDVESPVVEEVKEETKIEETIMYIPSGKCYELIKTFEGFKSKPYKCPAGIPTIGYGSTFYEDGTKVKLTDAPITEARAMELLADVVNDFSKKVNKLIKVEVNQNQFDALVDFAYNVGITALANSTLLKKLNAKLYSEAADQFLRWNKANGVVLAGLTKRRNVEKELFLS
jgi:lysozyme